MTDTRRIPSLVAALALATAPAAADEAARIALGASEYRLACATCHGMEGRGDGPMADMLKASVPDLTRLAARRGGVYPTDAVVRIIDGRDGLRGHGDPMPVWGERFALTAGGRRGPWGTEPPHVVEARIRALAAHVETLQVPAD